MTPEELRTYWDALVSGAPGTETDRDSDLAGTIHDLYAMDDTPAPDPARMDATWRALVGEPLNPRSFASLQIEAPDVNGHRKSETAWHGVAMATPPPTRRRRLDIAMRLNRLLAIGVLAGFGAGFVSGVGARLAMRVAGMLTVPANQGLLTDNDNVVGKITLDGTLFIAFFAGAIGVLGGLLYVVVRSRLPGTGMKRGLIFGVLLLTTFGFVIMDKNNPDYRLFGPPGVNVGTFSLVYILFGLIVAPLADRFDRRLPAWPAVRPLKRRTIAAYVAITPFGVIGFLAIIGGTIAGTGMAGALFGGLIALPLLAPAIRRLVRSTYLPRPAFAGYLALAAPSLIGLVLTVRAIAGILGVG